MHNNESRPDELIDWVAPVSANVVLSDAEIASREPLIDFDVRQAMITADLLKGVEYPPREASLEDTQ